MRIESGVERREAGPSLSAVWGCSIDGWGRIGVVVGSGLERGYGGGRRGAAGAGHCAGIAMAVQDRGM